jgi:short subunit dehydrogenase-like uncharacterized protein
MNTLMIYGAAGYTGRMAAGHAKSAGLNVIVAGRDEVSLAQLAAELGLPHQVFPLTEPEAVAAALKDVDVLLNCAGPFMRTAEPLMRGAIGMGVHYLDVAAELDSYRLAELLDANAKAAGVMLLPGSGGSVAMLGSLAGHAAARVEQPLKISIALRVAGAMSRGSLISATENLTTETLARIGDQLVPVLAPQARVFDFGWGEEECFQLTMPDLITIGRATGAPNIETFVHVAAGAFPTGDLQALSVGPDAAERLSNRYRAAVEVADESGAVVRSVLDTVNGYSFTALAAAEAARRVLGGENHPGFQTPAGLFGAGFAQTVADTTITDL